MSSVESLLLDLSPEDRPLLRFSGEVERAVLSGQLDRSLKTDWIFLAISLVPDFGACGLLPAGTVKEQRVAEILHTSVLVTGPPLVTLKLFPDAVYIQKLGTANIGSGSLASMAALKATSSLMSLSLVMVVKLVAVVSSSLLIVVSLLVLVVESTRKRYFLWSLTCR